MRHTPLLLMSFTLAFTAACGGESGSEALLPASVPTTSTTVEPTTPTVAEPNVSTSIAGTPTTVLLDMEPPVLWVTGPEEDANLTVRAVRFEGMTEPGATVVAWGRWSAEVADDGSWWIVLMLDPGTNIAQFTATDPAGNTTSVESVVRYTPPTTTTQPGAVAKTMLITYSPSVIPDEHREGWCAGPSGITPRAYACATQDDVVVDPCFDAGEVIVCEPNPITGDTGFVLDLIEPLPAGAPPGDPQPWILELYDGIVCYYHRGATTTFSDVRLTYGCIDPHSGSSYDSWVLENLRPGEVWTGHRVVLGSGSPREVVEDLGWVPIRTIWQ